MVPYLYIYWQQTLPKYPYVIRNSSHDPGTTDTYGQDGFPRTTLVDVSERSLFMFLGTSSAQPPNVADTTPTLAVGDVAYP